MWQESALPQPADPSEIVRQIANTVQRFDRQIFWRNFREYAAGGVMLMVFAYGAAFDHGRIVSMIGVVAMSFVLVYMWWKHRDIKPLDPSADARTYQTALIARFDRQIQLLHNARYWYFLPLYLVILAMTTASAMHRPAQVSPWAHAIMLAASLAFVTALYIWLARLNERHAVRLLTEAKQQAESLLSESAEQE
jgi:Na+/H+ antiporter NhaD/arsenite permease-like protein